MTQSKLKEQIAEGLRLLHEPGEVVEVRFFGDKRETHSGYFDDMDKLAAALVRYDGRHTLYQTLNPVSPDLKARSYNRITAWAKATTSDSQITERRWLPIDVDPKRASGISSSDEELALALDKAKEIEGWLSEQGWPKALRGPSGNGAHLLYRIELPNDDESRDLLKAFLEMLSERFTDEQIDIDTSVYNAARIWKIYGTVACKGDNIPERPHRRARLDEAELWPDIVTAEQIEALLPAKQERSVVSSHQRQSYSSSSWSGYTEQAIEDALSRAGVGYRAKSGSQGSIIYSLDRCLTSSEHTDGAAIILSDEGQAAYKCHHNSCSDKVWQDVRPQLFPEAMSRPAQPHSQSKPVDLSTVAGAQEVVITAYPEEAQGLSFAAVSSPQQIERLREAGIKRLFLALEPGQRGIWRSINLIKEAGLDVWIANGLEGLDNAERAGSWLARHLASQHELGDSESRELELARLLDRAAEAYLSSAINESPAERSAFVDSLAQAAQIHADYIWPELNKAYIRNREREQAQAFEGLLSRARRTAEEQGLTAARIALREGLAEQSLLSGATLPEPYLLAQALQDMLQAPPALDMGYESLSEFVSIPRAALSTVAAPSGQGKTTFMLNLLANWLDMPKHEDESFYFYTYEEPARAIALKLIMIWAGVERAAHSNYEAYLNYLKYHRGENEQIEAAIAKYERLSSSGRLYIIPAELDNEGLAAELSLIAKRGQVGAMLIDYIQLIPALRQAATRQLELQRTSQLLRDVARDSEIAVIVGSQLNEEGRVREARDIYQESALVLQLRSKAEDNGETPDMSVYVDKQRGGVSGVTKYLTFERPILKISDKLAARLEPMAEPEQTGLRF